MPCRAVLCCAVLLCCVCRYTRSCGVIAGCVCAAHGAHGRDASRAGSVCGELLVPVVGHDDHEELGKEHGHQDERADKQQRHRLDQEHHVGLVADVEAHQHGQHHRQHDHHVVDGEPDVLRLVEGARQAADHPHKPHAGSKVAALHAHQHPQRHGGVGLALPPHLRGVLQQLVLRRPRVDGLPHNQVHHNGQRHQQLQQKLLRAGKVPALQLG
mmetsp:Transcript_29085/g.73115  ORF Transcript_29085/g.73115 Transcript_29085/m.73115 type:complete len:213 (-) Transcript_29085:677-1315(-)